MIQDVIHFSDESPSNGVVAVLIIFSASTFVTSVLLLLMCLKVKYGRKDPNLAGTVGEIRLNKQDLDSHLTSANVDFVATSLRTPVKLNDSLLSDESAVTLAGVSGSPSQTSNLRKLPALPPDTVDDGVSNLYATVSDSVNNGKAISSVHGVGECSEYAIPASDNDERFLTSDEDDEDSDDYRALANVPVSSPRLSKSLNALVAPDATVRRQSPIKNDDQSHPYAKVKREHPYAKVKKVQPEIEARGERTVSVSRPVNADTVHQRDVCSFTQAVRRYQEHISLPSAVEPASLPPVLNPPLTIAAHSYTGVESQLNFSGDSQDSSSTRGYTSITVRESARHIVINNDLDISTTQGDNVPCGVYVSVSETSDEVYAAICDETTYGARNQPNYQSIHPAGGTSESASETYAIIDLPHDCMTIAHVGENRELLNPTSHVYAQIDKRSKGVQQETLNAMPTYAEIARPRTGPSLGRCLSLPASSSVDYQSNVGAGITDKNVDYERVKSPGELEEAANHEYERIHNEPTIPLDAQTQTVWSNEVYGITAERPLFI